MRDKTATKGQRYDYAVSRRAWLAACSAALLPIRVRAASPTIRLGILQFGSVQWVADVIRRHGLDAKNGFALETVTLANTDGGRIALMAGAVDVFVSDWFFVASQRAAGVRLSFSPFSSASGGIMVRAGSPIHTLSDLANRRLGVAGGPLDKSWLIVQAVAHSTSNLDLLTSAKLTYGAPPLLNALLQRDGIDAVLTYWNFAARLDGVGFKQMISVKDCGHTLGLSGHPSLIGFVFHEDWAKQNAQAQNGFLKASATAQAILVEDENEWDKIRPLTDTADDDALFHNLRRRFIEGVQQAPLETQERDATKLFEIVLRVGGARSTGGLEALPEGVFWRPDNG